VADAAWWSAALWSGMRSTAAVRTAPRLMPCSRAWVAVAGLRGTRRTSAMVLPGQPIVTTAVALGLGDPQPVVSHFPMETALQFAGGGEALHLGLHVGQTRASSSPCSRCSAERATGWGAPAPSVQVTADHLPTLTAFLWPVDSLDCGRGLLPRPQYRHPVVTQVTPSRLAIEVTKCQTDTQRHSVAACRSRHAASRRGTTHRIPGALPRDSAANRRRAHEVVAFPHHRRPRRRRRSDSSPADRHQRSRRPPTRQRLARGWRYDV
jgi:hypothetical protein